MSIIPSVVTHAGKRLILLPISNPPVNSLSHAIRSSLLKCLLDQSTPTPHALVLYGNGATFPAGADVAEFETGTWSKSPDLGQVIEALDKLNIPIVAGIHGTALGGGLEVALGCHYRVAADTAKLGVPEVLLGILPGAQGTQRLPRVAGAKMALEMMLSGNTVTANDALKAGIVDRVVPEKELMNAVLDFAAGITTNGKELPRISQRPAAKPLTEEEYSQILGKLAQRGHVSGPKIVEAVKTASNPAIKFEAGVKKEAELFKELMATPEAQGLQHMFFAERACVKVPGVNPKGGLDVQRVGIIGSGTMGSGIAMCFAAKGTPVVLCDSNHDALKRGMDNIEQNWRRSSAFKTGKLTEDQLKKRLSLITPSTDSTLAPLANCDAVIEAVFENLQIKQEIFKKLDKVVKSPALLCSNTSYLDVDQIAGVTKRPEWVMGTHFFSPAHVMPLLENVRGSKTSEQAIATAMKMGKNIGKTAVISGNAFGFIGNRMFEPYTQQAILLLEEGVTPSEVDKPLGPGGFGMAMGPLAVFDLAGNDIGYRIRRESYYPHTPDRVKGKRGATWMALADQLCDAGRHGQKTGKGWYAYDPQTRKASDDPIVITMAKEHAAKHGIPKTIIDSKQVVERCVFSMINEGFRILEEGVAVRSSDIDVVWNYGYGFPRYRGGPMFYADRIVGLSKLRDTLLRYRETQPELPRWHFTPAPLLDKLVKEGKTLKEFEASKS